MIGPTQRTLPGNTQHSQQTDFHASGKIRTRIPSRRAAAHPPGSTFIARTSLYLAGQFRNMHSAHDQ